MIEFMKEETIYDCWELAHGTKVFTNAELNCLAEDLRSCLDDGTDYTCVYLEPEDKVAGFINFGQAPITSGSWFIYWIAVDKNKHGEGIGQKLLEYAESFIRKQKGRLVYIETSAGQAKFRPARKAYENAGYEQIAHLKNYYKTGDGKYIYVKAIKSKRKKKKPH